MATPTGRNSSPPPGPEGDHYQVVARRYRPQSFAELVGQAHVASALSNAIQQNRVGHAYLFSGARGTGKTSTARILAKCLNCQQGSTLTPCQMCDSCQGITGGDDIDVLEIDGASNRRIEEIRQLRSNVNVRPSRSRYKIYIIDEVHMLTKEAFNALLKTLEEPPDHVKFFFCTTELDKIPITIRSRCQLFEFMPVDEGAIRERLRQIAQRENVDIAEDALIMLARRAAGSLRDSQSLLEQLLVVGSGPIAIEDVHRFLGTADSSLVGRIVEFLIAHDAPGALATAQEAFRKGVDGGQLAAQLLGFFRDGLAASVGCPDDLLLFAAPDQFAQVRAIGAQFGLETCLAAAQILDEALSRMRSSSHPQILLEIALVRIARLDNLQAISDLLEQLRSSPTGKSAGGRPALTAPPSPRREPAASTIDDASTTVPSVVSKKNEPPKTEPSYLNPALTDRESPASLRLDEPHESPGGESITADNVATIWKRALQTLGDTTADMAAKYRRLEWNPDGRIVATLSEQFHRYCNLPERKTRLEQALAEIAGHAIRVEFVAVASAEGPATPQPVSRLKQMRDSARDARVRAAIDIFDASVTDVLSARGSGDARPASGGEVLPTRGEVDA